MKGGQTDRRIDMCRPTSVIIGYGYGYGYDYDYDYFFLILKEQSKWQRRTGFLVATFSKIFALFKAIIKGE